MVGVVLHVKEAIVEDGEKEARGGKEKERGLQQEVPADKGKPHKPAAFRAQAHRSMKAEEGPPGLGLEV